MTDTRQEPTLPLPAKRAVTVAEMLAQIPDLAVEVAMTADAPNPGPKAATTSRPVPGSRPPINLHVVDLLATSDPMRDEDHSTRPLIRLGECSRIVWEALDDDLRAAHPQPECLTWASECGWLRAAYVAAQHLLDESDYGWITSEVTGIYRSLAAQVQLHAEPRFVCTRLGCGATAHLQDGGRWVLCRNGHTLDVEAEKGRHLSMQDWTLAECRRALATYLGKHVPQKQLEKWVQRDALKPVRHDYRGVGLFNFGAVAAKVAAWETRRRSGAA